MLLIDKTFSRILKYVKENYFDAMDDKNVLDAIKRYDTKYGKTPDANALCQFLSVISVDDELQQYVKDLPPPGDRADFVKESMRSFVCCKEYETLQMDMSSLLASGDLDEVQNRAQEINAIRIDQLKPDYDYLGMLDHRNSRNGQNPIHAVRTGFIGIDSVLDSGGLSGGELGLIVAPPSGGKSMALVNLGKNALMAGHNVFHFTEEMSDNKTARRYDQCLSGMTKEEIQRRPVTLSNRIRELLDGYKSHLTIKEHQSNSCTIADLKRDVELTVGKMRKTPGLIIVDYADLCIPQRRYEERRFELESIYRDLRSLGQLLDCPVWTASQSDVDTMGIGTKSIRMNNLSESKVGKAAIIDVMISVNQTMEQKKAQRGSLYIAKNRDSEKDVSVPVRINWSRANISDLTHTKGNQDDD